MDEQPRKKVVILGGGMAALTVAYELTSRADWKQKFSEISVYQLGWRLGGKGASGRNPQAGSRIEGHGSHVWLGCYHHAFRLLRGCYAELDRPAGQPLSQWQEAFQPQDGIVVYEERDGQPRPWSLTAPPNDMPPGDPIRRLSPWEFIARGTQLVHAWWKELRNDTEQRLPKDKEPHKEWTDQWVSHAAEYTGHLHEAVRRTGQTKPLMTTALNILDQTHQTVTEYVESLIGMDERERQLWIQQDLALTAMRGALRDGVPLEGFDVLDHLDFRAWLKRHGASPRTLSSPLLTGLYDFVFASVKGDYARQDLAAGVGLRLLCRATFDYRGAVLWTTPMGMGDAVFAPLYEVLRRRGVQFHFFHRLQNLRLSADGSSVAEIHLERQATPTGDYEPLIDVKGLPCWPGAPRYELLKEGDELQKRRIDLESIWTDWQAVKRLKLEAGKDFDDVVLGVSLAALPHCCPDLIAAAPQWREMLQQVQTVPTAVSQLWFNRTQGELGWDLPSPFLTAFVPPLDTCADDSRSLGWEAWDAPNLPRSVAALRGALRDADEPPASGLNDYPQRQQQRVQEAALAWFRTHSARLWPGLHGAQQMHWEFLVDPQDQQKEARFHAQFHRANINPSDRYVQSVAGSTRFRISPSQVWFGNLCVCGDWTRTGLNAGCIEAAVLSGLQAAAALRSERPAAELTADW